MMAQGIASGERAKENALQKWEGRAVKQRFYLGWKSIWEKLGLRNRAIQQVSLRAQTRMRLMVTLTAWRNSVRETKEQEELTRTHLEYRQQMAGRLMSYVGGVGAKSSEEAQLKVKKAMLTKWQERVKNEKKIRRRVNFFADQCKEDFFSVWKAYCVNCVTYIDYRKRGRKAAERMHKERIKAKARVIFKMWGVFWVTKRRMRGRFVEHKDWFQHRWDNTVVLRHGFEMWRFTKTWSAQLRAAKDAANLTTNGVRNLRERK